MDACIIAGFSLIVMLATISLIGAWLSNDSKGIKIACTITIIIAIAAFLCAYMRNPFCFNGDEGMIGTIATIVSIPVTVLLGWNIYTLIDVKSLSKNLDKAEENILRQVDYKINSFNSNSAKDMGVLTAVTMVVSSPTTNETDTLKMIITMYKEVMNNEKSFALSYCVENIKSIIENDTIYERIDKGKVVADFSIDVFKKLQIHLIQYYDGNMNLINRSMELLSLKLT